MSSPKVDWLRAHQARRAAFLSCVLNAVGSPVDLWMGKHLPELPYWPVLVSVSVGALGCVVLLRLPRASIRFSSAIFLINNAAVIFSLWVLIPYFSQSPSPWTPLHANKLGMLMVAALGPELVPGVITIVGFAACALARWVRLAHLPGAGDEPAVLFTFGVVAVVLLVLRMRAMASERQLLQSKNDTEVAQQLAQRLMALRDLANTPLQTIEAASALLQRQHPQAADLTEKLTRAAHRMRDLQQVLHDDPRSSEAHREQASPRALR